MGYNSYCYYQNCVLGCCDISGYCPVYSYNCYAYYYTTDKTGTIAGSVVGGIIGLAIVIGLIIYCYRRNQQNQFMLQQQQMGYQNTQQNLSMNSMGQNVPYGQPMTYGQPVYGQPYGQQQPFIQPNAYPQPNPFNQPNPYMQNPQGQPIIITQN